MTTLRGLALLIALTVLAAIPAVGASTPAVPSVSGPALADEVEDDLLQVALNRLVDEAREFGSFTGCDGIINPCDRGVNAQISVTRLDTGQHVETNGETAQVSLSAVKAMWVALAVREHGTAAVEGYAEPIFARSSDAVAGNLIDLLGAPPSEGIDFINDATSGWGLSNTWFRGWYGGWFEGDWYPARYASQNNGVWGLSNYTTPDELVDFWVMLSRGELLDEADTAQVLEWAAMPRSDQQDELIPTRLPAAVAEAVAHKSGFSDNFDRRIDGGLVTTPGGITYAIVLGLRAGSVESFHGGSADWARYASCEVYAVIAGVDRLCTRAGDPDAIVNHTTAPVGSLSTAAAIDRNRLRVNGWALDRDLGADPVDVRITVDGSTVDTLAADQLKTSVDRLHGFGNHHGFRATLDVSLASGDHQVCAVAINDSPAGANRTVGCTTVSVPDDYPPIGNLTEVVVKKDLVVAWGWAKDLDTAGPIEVKITLDGGKLRLIDADRGAGGHGFRLRLTWPLSPGDHEVCAIAQNFEDGGPNQTVGCKAVTVPEDWPPAGTLADSTADETGVWVKGRAWDSDTSDPIEIRVQVDGTVVGSVYADRGVSNRKYNDTVAISMTPGEHTVCTIAVNHTGGEPTTVLGCATVVVETG